MIFLYEPDVATAAVMGMIFEELGTHAYVARTEAEALRAVSTWAFNYVFLDCWQSTHDTCRSILLAMSKQGFDPTKTEIIIMKQAPWSEQFHDIVETYRVLVKPFDVNTLEFILGKTIQERAESKKNRSPQEANEQTVRKNQDVSH